jgi:hypothetical protein
VRSDSVGHVAADISNELPLSSAAIMSSHFSYAVKQRGSTLARAIAFSAASCLSSSVEGRTCRSHVLTFRVPASISRTCWHSDWRDSHELLAGSGPPLSECSLSARAASPWSTTSVSSGLHIAFKARASSKRVTFLIIGSVCHDSSAAAMARKRGWLAMARPFFPVSRPLKERSEHNAPPPKQKGAEAAAPSTNVLTPETLLAIGTEVNYLSARPVGFRPLRDGPCRDRANH